MRGTGSVVVTGASKGIGRATALLLDQQGWRVFAGVRQDEDGDALRAEASARLTPLGLDVTDQTALARACALVERAVGSQGLQGLVNNAGIVVPGPLEFLPLDDLRLQMEVNLIGVAAVTQAFLPALRSGLGRIVNVGSINGRLAVPFTGAYCASKHALEAYSDSLRMELRPWSVDVSLIQPGAIVTPIWDTSRSRVREIIRRMPAAASELYGRIMERALQDEGPPAHAIPAETVARAIERALTSRRPRARYVVGKDARLALLLARLPDRLRDRILVRRRRGWRQPRGART